MASRLYAWYLVVCMMFVSMLSYAQLSADFHANIITGCAPIVVQFADASSGNPVQWNWNLGNGTTSTQQNPSTTYILPGYYTVSLTVSDGQGSNTTTKTNYIHVTSSPQVRFFASDSQNICPPATIQFTNQTISGAPGNVNYNWDFGDGNTSNLENPGYTYTTPGNYLVTLVATNSNNCPGSLIRQIQVVNRPQANFSASNNTGCTAPLTVTFSNTSTNAGSYTWFFGDGGTSSVASPTRTYTAPGNYTVTLIARNAGGCADTLILSNLVRIARPAASFNLSSSSICAGTSVSFTNTSIGAASYEWNFGDNTTSTLATPPAKAYNTAGNYTIRLIAIHGSCRDTFIRTLTVLQRPVANFTADSAAGCKVPHTVQFTNSSTGASSYGWTFGDGGTSTQINPGHTYTTTGTRTVTLTATGPNGCTATRTMSVPVVILTPTITAMPAGGGCTGDTMRFTGAVSPPPYPISSYSWTFGDGGTGSGANTFHIYNTPGVYSVTLNILTVNGCLFTRTINVNMSARPDASFTASPLNICVNEPVTFTNTSTGALTDFWQFGDGIGSSSPNPVHRYQDTGTYTVRLIAFNNYCSDTVTEVDLIRVTGPEAAFIPVYSCTDRLSVAFTNNSVRAVDYSWDFGDGNSSILQSPTHPYAAAGTYTVRLVATDANGCRDTATSNITVYAPPTVDFSADDTSICKGQTVVFTRLANPAGYTYNWSFGEGTPSSASTITVSKQYNIANTYTVRLIVSDGRNCRDTMIKQNYIHVGAPVPQFTSAPNPATGCSPLTVNFTDQSTTPGSTMASRTWHFGDGTVLTGNDPAPSHTYYSSTAQNYNVKLVVADANGCRDSATVSSMVRITRPGANFNNPAQACKNQPVTFTNTSSGASSYIWDFGDGSTGSTQQHPVHTYTTAGTYSVRLIAVSSTGCRDTLLKNNTIRIDEVIAGFNVNDSVADCPPLIVQFGNTSSGASTYIWNFGNGISSSVTNPSTVYTMPGVYTVLLVATGNGCTDSAIRTITVNGPNAQGGFDYTPQSGCVPFTVSFSAVAVNTQTYSWDMNNGSTYTTATGAYTYTYTEPGAYVPVLVLSNSANCNVAFIGTDTIHVDELEGDFSFTASSFCIGNPVQFRDTVYQSGSQQITRNWDFGDGSGSIQQHPSHTYTAAGSYTVRLVLANGNGCADTITRNVTIHDLPVITATATPPAICPGETIQLQAAGADTFSWSPGADLSCTACPDPVATPLSPVTYVVWGTDAHGCTDSTSVSISTGIKPVLAVVSDTTVCYGADVTLTASGAATYTWLPATGLSCSNCPDPLITATATISYTVIGASSDGCTDTAQVTVTVNPLPVLTITPSQSICAGTSLQLQAGGADNYNWSPSAGLSCTACPDPVATPAATTTYIVTGTDINNCFDTAQVTVSVISSPSVNVTDRDICFGDSVQLQATGATTYQWLPATGLSCAACSDPLTSPATTTMYTVIGSIAGGCSDTVQVAVTVHDLPVVSGGQDQDICTGSSATLQATGAAAYSWSPGAGLSCTNCDNPTATPGGTTTYTVVGTDGNGCRDTSAVTITLLPLPAIITSPDDAICIGDSISLTASGAATYSWSPGTGLSCTGCSDPLASPVVTTTYTVIGTDTNSCVDSGRVTISVISRPVIVVADEDVCFGDSVQLQASGAATYQWSPATGLSCTACSDPLAAPSATTTYTIVGMLTSGCTDSVQATITVHDLPVVSAGQDQEICIGSSAALQATGAVTYSWSPGTGLSCTNCDNPTATPSGTTTYTVVGTDGNSCRDTAEVVVTLLPLPVITTLPDDAICIGDSISLTASGAATYSWSPVTGLSCTNCADPLASPATTITYTVIGTDTNSCTDSAQVTINVISRPVILVADEDICLGDSVQLQASGAVTFQWSPADGLGCTNCPDPLASPAATTTYTVRGTLISGCSDSVEVTVTVHDLPVVSAGQDQEICTGLSATLQASGAATYSWSPGTGLSCTNCDNPTATPAGTTTYTLVGTDGNGCRDTTEVTVTLLPLPTITTSPDEDICIGDSISLTASGAATYSWSPATGLSCTACPDPLASPGVTTTYTVIGTDTNGCVDSARVTISVISRPVIVVSDEDVCLGDSVQLQASGAATYQWSPATGLSCTVCPDPLASPSSTTTYTIVGMLASGCTDSVRATVTVHDLPVVSAGQDQEICIGSSVALQATGAVTYSWSPGTGLSCTNCDNPTASPPDTMVYIVSGASAAGCINYDTVVVNVKPLPVISAGNNRIVCRGDTVHLAATGGVSYVWDATPDLSCLSCPDPVALPVAPATYRVTGTGTNNCTDTASMIVSFYPQPVLNGGGNRDLCIGDTLRLQASGGVSYTWSPATDISCVACADPDVWPATTTTYTLTGESTDGCVDSVQVTVTVHPIPVVSAGTDREICLGNNTVLNASGAATYTWTPASGLSCTNCATPSASPVATTLYTVIGLSQVGCADTAEVTVTVYPLPPVTTGTDPVICRGDTTQLQASGANVYVWSPPAGLSCTGCADPVANPSAPTTYTVTGTDTNGCVNTSQVRVLFYPDPVISAGSDQTICRGEFAQLQASGGISYTWSPTSGLSCTDCPDPVATPGADMRYYVTGTDENGCTGSDTVAVLVVQPVATSAGDDVRICAGQATRLSASGGVRYIWSPVEGLSCTECADPVARPDTTTRYRVIIAHNYCFEDTLYQSVEVLPIPTVDLGADQHIFAGEQVRLFANSMYASSYTWSPPDGLSCTDCIGPVATPDRTVTYQVTAYNELGCSATDDIRIVLKCDGSMLFVPNTFTPNGDGQNDRFFPHANGIRTVDMFKVFNRWGEVMFERQNMPVNDPVHGWDGTFKGQVLSPDTYVYILQATCINGEQVTVKGDISLVR